MSLRETLEIEKTGHAIDVVHGQDNSLQHGINGDYSVKNVLLEAVYCTYMSEKLLPFGKLT